MKIMDNIAVSNLKELASHYSFGRVLCRITLNENTSLAYLAGHELDAAAERIINKEFDFLASLWLDNIDLSLAGWNIEEDDEYLQKVYNLLNNYHNSLKGSSFGEVYSEMALYEGDEAYDWQFIELAELKYKPLDNILIEKFGYHSNCISSLYKKLKLLIEQKLQILKNNQTVLFDEKTLYGLFSFSEDEMESSLTLQELSTLKNFCTRLGENKKKNIWNIQDLSIYSTHPIIILPNGHYCILNFYLLAHAFCISPYYWILNTVNKKEIPDQSDLWGKNNEIIVSKVLDILDGNKIINTGINIQRKDSKQKETDIDILMTIGHDVFVFQIKSKRLRVASINGNETCIKEDYKEAVEKAYSQGIKCVNALKDANNYRDLSKYSVQSPVYHIVCVTGDYYQTITPSSLIHNIKNNGMPPLIAMSLFDLHMITHLFSAQQFVEYIKFREKCCRLFIYAVNEVFFIGKFLVLKLVSNEPALLKKEILPREYALLADIIIQEGQKYGHEKPYLDAWGKMLKQKDTLFERRLLEVLKALDQKEQLTYQGIRTHG